MTPPAESFERQSAEEQLRKLAMVVEQSPSSIIITNTEPVIEYVNQAFVDTTGYSVDEVVGKNPNILNQGLTSGDTYAQLWATLARGEIWKGEFRNTRKDGSQYLEIATIAPIRQSDGTITHYVAIKSDITDLRRSQSRVYELANYDDLTGLANRFSLTESIERAASACHLSGRHGMVLVLDVDGFKVVNDVHGHESGDQLLISIAGRLKEILSDDSAVARIGGNRFAVVVESLSRKRSQAVAQVHDLAGLIHEELKDPHQIDLASQPIRLSNTMGAALISPSKEEAQRLLNQAETALQRGRNDARNAWYFFNPNMQVFIESQSEIEGGLHDAIEQDQLSLFCQSQFDAQGLLTGAECLVRWRHPEQGNISPDRFIPLAEESGQILPLGAWVLNAACSKLHKWSKDPRTAQLQLAVNVSARQFHQPDFVQNLLEALYRYDISPGRLKLELTETVVLKNVEQTEQRMLAIRDLGIGLALDDFGTGFSSLSYLKNLPFDTLKIDRSFVSDMVATKSSAAIVQATIAMGHALGLTIIAEGVENHQEWSMLKGFDCDAFQGFLFARPQAADLWEPSHFSAEQ